VQYDRRALKAVPPRGCSILRRLAFGAGLLAALLALGLPGPAAAQDADTPEESPLPALVVGPAGLTLGDAVAAALADGHQAQIAQLETDRSRDAAGQERSAYLPRASITSNAGYNNRWNEKLVAVNGNGQVKEYGLTNIGSDEGWFNVYLDQLLLDLATWQRIERAELEAEAASLGQQQERELVAFDVVQRFVDALRQERLVALAQERLAATEALDQQAAYLLAAGRSRPADREQVALLLQEARIDVATRTSELGNARASLALGMGRAGSAAPDRLDASSLPDTRIATGAEPDVSTSPELRVLDLRRRVEEKGISIARAGYLPTVAMRGGYSHYGVKRYDNYPDAARVGVNVEIPLFQGLKNEYAVGGAAKSAEIARLRYRQTLEAKRARVHELAERLVSGQDTPGLAARRAAISRERLRLAELNLRADRGSLDEALGALGDSATHGRLAIDSELDRVLLWAQLRRETGTLARILAGDAAPAAPSQN
jgi:outer membrane protein TolC